MLFNSAKVFSGIMLMIGAAQAQVGNDGTTSLAPSGRALRDPSVRPWPAAPGTGGHVVIPQSSIPTPGDAGKRAHTRACLQSGFLLRGKFDSRLAKKEASFDSDMSERRTICAH